jgi:hypothetical protein
VFPGRGRRRRRRLANSAPNLLAPGPDAFVRDHHAAPGQDQLDVAQAEAENMIKPNGVADDLDREVVTMIGTEVWRYLGSFARLASSRQPRLT